LKLEADLAREVGLARSKDDELLSWAAENGRVVLTHDRNTLVGRAHARTQAGLRMLGVVVVDDHASESLVAENLVLITFATHPHEWVGQVHYVPL
jgi:predicted nuclease of predicted toxin-antitoxin system